MSSTLYARNYNETKTLGGSQSSIRTPQQTASVFGPKPAIPCTATDVNDPNMKREYTSIVEMVDKHRNVRVWGGIHFRNSLEVGEDMGRKIADYLIDNALTPAQ